MFFLFLILEPPTIAPHYPLSPLSSPLGPLSAICSNFLFLLPCCPHPCYCYYSSCYSQSFSSLPPHRPIGGWNLEAGGCTAGTAGLAVVLLLLTPAVAASSSSPSSPVPWCYWMLLAGEKKIPFFTHSIGTLSSRTLTCNNSKNKNHQQLVPSSMVVLRSRVTRQINAKCSPRRVLPFLHGKQYLLLRREFEF